MIIGRFDVECDSLGMTVYENGICVGRIDGVSVDDCLDEDDIDDLLYDDLSDDDYWGEC